MVAVPLESMNKSTIDDAKGESDLAVNTQGRGVSIRERSMLTREGNELKMRPNYMYREANWEIGRVAEKTNVKVRQFVRGDRFLAWRKTGARKTRNAEKRSIGRGGKKGKK